MTATDGGTSGPAAAEDQTLDRRGFLKAAAGLLGGLVGLVLAVPLVGTLVGSLYARGKVPYAKVGSIAALPIGRPVSLRFAYQSRDAFMADSGMRDVWVIRHSASDITVFSPICPHLSCHYDWDAQAQQFRCPCHGSLFSLDGKVLGGPAPRPLDTLPYKIEGDELLVEWQRFQPGVARKIAV
jgi:menaquinol-cytochrome c reductase iron-sulfur subunit